MLLAGVCGLGAAAPTPGKTVTNGRPAVADGKGTQGSARLSYSGPSKNPGLQQRTTEKH